MGKIRIYDLAKRHNKTNAEIKELLEKGGMDVASASVSVDETQAESILVAGSAGRKPRRIAVRRRRRAEPEPEPVVEAAAAEPAAPEAVEPQAEADAPSAAEQSAEPAPVEAPEPVAAEPVAADPVAEPEPAAPVSEPESSPEAAPEVAASDSESAAEAPATAEASADEAPQGKTQPVAEAPGAPKPAQVKPVARVVRVIDAEAIRSRLQAEGRRGFGRPRQGGPGRGGPGRGGPARGPGGPGRGGMNRGPRPGGPGAGRPGGLGTGMGVGSPEGMPGGPGGPGQRARRGAPRPGGKAKRKRRMSKKALLELQGEALLQRERHRLDEETLRQLPSAHKRILKVGDSIRVGELAHEMSVKAAEVVRALFMNGMMVTLTQSIDFDTASLIAEEFGYQVEPSEATDDELLVTHVDSSEELLLRPPVVTVMGHVDHGKTSLLDKIREANVVSGEAGGITQHIGAYSVECPSGAITFLDTPGHAAFSAMRARGAEVTDVVVLVVAADDGIKPQTAEAIKHAKAAQVPLLVALNKMDKEGARPDNVLQELTAHELVPEEWGGDVQVQRLSAKTGEGVDELLEKLALQAEILELRANPSKPGIGTVVEAQLDRGRGAVATVLVQQGTMRKGDIIVAGQHHGRVRAMYDDQGHEVLEAGPSFPVAVLGLSGVPSAGDPVNVADEKVAKEVAERRAQRSRESELAVGARVNLESFMAHGAPTSVARQLKLVIKGDVQGSVEALRHSLTELSGPKVEVRVIYAGVGAITANDVNLAVASEAVIIGFNIRPDTKGAEAASQEGIDLRCYKVIYDVVDDVRAAMEGMLEPIRKESYLGRAEVRDTFRVPKLGTVAGCLVTSGLLRRSAQVRLLRDHQEIYVGELSSLRRFKDDVPEVKSGTECGMGLVGWSDLQEGDLIECFEVQEIRAKLDEHNVAPEPEPETAGDASDETEA